MFITQFPPNFSLLITPGSITTVKKSLTVFKMFKQVSKQLGFQVTRRHFSIGKQNNYKIAVCGANGGIGRPLSLLLRLNPMVTRLNLYDIVGTRGVAADLLHIDRTSKIQPFTGPKELAACLKHSDIVIIAAGFPRKPGMDRADLLKMNASVVVGIIDSIAKNCPKALIALITNPVNILVPIAAEVLFKRCEYDPQRLFGVSTLDVVRAQAFIGTSENVDPRSVQVEVIGGHSGKTIIPVISQSKPTFTKDVEKLVKRIQEAGTEVVKAKAGAGSATLSMAFSGARFVNSLMRGMAGENNIIECSYVESNVTEARFFATPILLGPNGIKKNLGLPDLSDFEKKLLKAAMPEILANIKTGIDFVESEID